MRDLDAGHQRGESLLQAAVAVVGIGRLAGLVVLAAEDHHVVAAVGIDPEVPIGIGGVPPEGVGHRAGGDAPGHDVAGVEGQLGLKERGGHHPRDAHQRIVRRHHDVAAAHPVAARGHRERVGRELGGVGVLVDPAARLDQRLREARQVAPRMQPRLSVEANAGGADQGDLAQEGRVEPQLRRQLGLALQAVLRLRPGLSHGKVEIALHPVEAAVDLVLPDDLVHLPDGRQARVPDRLRVGPAEALHHLAQAGVGDHGEMSGGVTGVSRGAAAAVQHQHGAAGAGETVRRGQSGDPGPDHDHVGLGVGFEPGVAGEGGRGGPVGGGVRQSRHGVSVGGASPPSQRPGSQGSGLSVRLGHQIAPL